MTVRRSIAAGVFSLVILLSLGAIVFIYAVNNTQTTTVYALKHEVFVGQQADPGDVVPLTVKASSTEFDFAFTLTQSDLGGRVYVSHRVTGDILAKDDLAAQKQPALVSLVIAGGPTLVAGDAIDIYTTQGGVVVLIGRHIPVFAAGTPVTLAVSPDYAPYWVAISTSKASLTAVKTSAQSPCRGQAVGISVDAAITFLLTTGGGGDPGAKNAPVNGGPVCAPAANTGTGGPPTASAAPGATAAP